MPKQSLSTSPLCWASYLNKPTIYAMSEFARSNFYNIKQFPS